MNYVYTERLQKKHLSQERNRPLSQLLQPERSKKKNKTTQKQTHRNKTTQKQTHRNRNKHRQKEDYVKKQTYKRKIEL